MDILSCWLTICSKAQITCLCGITIQCMLTLRTLFPFQCLGLPCCCMALYESIAGANPSCFAHLCLDLEAEKLCTSLSNRFSIFEILY